MSLKTWTKAERERRVVKLMTAGMVHKVGDNVTCDKTPRWAGCFINGDKSSQMKLFLASCKKENTENVPGREF